MQHLLLILLQLVSTLPRLFRPGGVKALVTENLLLKHQLLIVRRSRRRAPNLRCSDRLLFGLGSLLLSPRRLVHTAIVIKPSTLLRWHHIIARRVSTVVLPGSRCSATQRTRCGAWTCFGLNPSCSRPTGFCW